MDAASLLERARTSRDELEVRLLLAACVGQAALAAGARSVLTGGTAADFYASSALGTSSAYPLKWRPSQDVDVVVLSIEPFREARGPLLSELEKLGMVPRYVGNTARAIDVPGVPYLLEIVGEELSRDPRGERVVTVLLDGETPLTIRSPEDVILAYAESGWHLRHGGDWLRALAVYSAMKDRLDHARMEEEAAKRGQLDPLAAVIRQEPSPWRNV